MAKNGKRFVNALNGKDSLMFNLFNVFKTPFGFIKTNIIFEIPLQW